ncbi:MAG: beta-N-acetylhexosaminidase [Vicinamibacterales bacterium]
MTRATVPNLGLVPLPRVVEPTGMEPFAVTAGTAIVLGTDDERLRGIARFLRDLIGTAAAPTPPAIVAPGGAVPPGAIVLELGEGPVGAEAYALHVTPDRVTIRGREPAGVFRGVQTLRQLLPPLVEFQAVRPDVARPVRVPAVRIEDAPRFEWRGAMLDVSRHFFPVADVQRFIDLMTVYKLNRLHLHLSDDQGWRVVIDSWPDLTEKGGASEVGGGRGGFYTKDDYTAIVRYAAERFITIVPEIDMPGHTNAALTSYPALNCDGAAPAPYSGVQVGFSVLCVDRESTYSFIDDVVRELAALTPGEWFHMGGDEVERLTPAQYVGFVERVQDIVGAHGKRMIGWDEIGAARLRETTVVQHWRPKTTAAAAVAKGAKVVVSIADRAYIDMKPDPATPIGQTWAAVIDVRTAYDWDPVATAGVPAQAVLGVEAPLWSETIATIDEAEHLAFPRLAALAEVGWSDAARRGWEEFRLRLAAQGPRLAALGVNFHRDAGVPWTP